jgi:hypothetical protein
MKSLITTFFISFFSLCSAQSFTAKSGYYEYLTLIVNGKKVYGQYEYYDKYNKKDKNFENENVFYFAGETGTSDTVKIILGLPGRKTTTGYLIARDDSVELQFSGFSVGYGNEDFGIGYTAKLDKPINYIGLGIIADEKCRLYDAKSTASLSKKFLVNEDFVGIIERDKEWVKVEYVSPYDPKHIKIIKWIKAKSLYNEDPKLW